MRLATLDREWKKLYPTGAIVRDDTGFLVWFKTGHRGYHYSERTVYALAERLDMIPQYDVMETVHMIVDVLRSGSDIVTIAGQSDNIRHYCHDRDFTFDEEIAGEDEFGRALGRYFLIDSAQASLWSCTG